jgi:maltose alpha-D-glucosyltransferase/alpha-amylase
MKARRWYRGKARTVRSTQIREAIPVPIGRQRAAAILMEVNYTEGDPELYDLPVAVVRGEAAERLLHEAPHAVIAWIAPTDVHEEDAFLVDAAHVPEFALALLDVVGDRRRLRGGRVELIGRPERSFRELRGRDDNALVPAPIRSEQSNTSVVLGDRLILKLYRSLENGSNPDLEVGRFLTERGFGRVPGVAGSLEYRSADGAVGTAAILQQFVPNEGDVFRYTLDTLATYFERSVAVRLAPEPGGLSTSLLLDAAREDLPETAREAIGAYLDISELLGVRTGELHAALASEPSDPAFAPEPFTELYQRSIYQSIQATVRQSLRLLASRRHTLEPRAAEDAERVLDRGADVDQRLRGLLGRRLGGTRIRHHGDFHTGQVLYTGRDLVIIDFEGEPARPLGERRLKRSALTDVAGMLRSFHYAVHGSLVRAELGPTIREEDVPALEPWVRWWYRWVGTSYLRGYRRATAGTTFLPEAEADWLVLLDAFLLQKAFYELSYELSNRPAWVAIPLRGIVELTTP